MENKANVSSRNEIIRIVAIYALFGCLWIYLSDSLLGIIISDPTLLSRLSMYKGLLFIALTASLLYVLISRYVTRIGLHIRELNNAQQLLAQQKELLDVVIEGTTDAIYIKDSEGRYVLANQAVANFVNKPLADIIGYDDTVLFPAGEADILMEQDRWAMAQTGPQTYEEHLTTPGGVKHFFATKGAVRNERGEVTGLFGISRDITERKLTEIELTIATISINNIADAVYWVLPDGKIWRVNTAASHMLGYSQDELRSMSLPDIDPYFPLSRWQESWQQLKQTKTTTLESVHRTKDGRDIPIEITANYIVFEDQEFNCATVRDISERRQNEIALEQEQIFTKKLLESLPGIFYLYSYPELRLVLWNKNHEVLLGYEAEELVNRNLFDWHVPAAKEAVRAAVEAVMEKGQDEVEAPLVAKDGTLVPFHLTGIRFESGGKLFLMGIGIDISERIQTEKTLDERNRLLDTLLANLPIGVFMVEAPSGKPLIANKKAQELLGRGVLPDTSKGSLTEVYEAYKAGTKKRYPVEEMPIIRGMYGESVTVDDLLVVRPDGTEKLLEIVGAPVLDGNGVPWASLVCFQDITDRKQHEKENLKIEKLESLGILAGGIAHDFNNILTGILGNISFALRLIEPDHKAYKRLSEAEQASGRAGELSHQLLTFAKGGEPVKKLVSLQKLLQESVSLVLSGSNVKGIIDIADSLPLVKADEGQISQVFNNIIINATQAMPGGGNLAISAGPEQVGASDIITVPAGSYVKIAFSDEGCGISDDYLNRIFDPYFTTKSAGNGLGLASAHSIVTRHGGTITVASTVGYGSTFIVYLPSAAETAINNHDVTPVHQPDDQPGGSILVMDDEQSIRELTAEVLEYLGYQVKTVPDGSAAVALYEAALDEGTPFSAVLLDLTIPGGMGGKEAAQKILAINPHACLIVASGYSNDQIMSSYASFGFSGAIAKPFRMDEIEQLLRSLVQR